MKAFPIDDWDRRETFQHFVDYPMPHLVLGAHLQIGEAYQQLKQAGLSPFLFTVHSICRAANESLPFRLRLRDRHQIVEHECVHPSFTRPEGTEAFGLRRCSFQADPFLFQEQALQAPDLKFGPQSDQAEEDAWIFLSCLPWLHFSHAMLPFSPDTVSVPRILWGQLRQGLLPVSVQVHHALMDGLHVARFLERLEQLLQDPPRPEEGQ